MLPFFTNHFGNAGSRSHAFGWEAEEAVETARAQVAALINADPKEIVFTSGATEGNNLAIKGVANMHAKRPAGEQHRGHIITATHEHKAVLDPCRRLEREGFDVTFIQPGPDGVITAEHVAEHLRDDTILVSIMWANNEIGTINDVHNIAKLCRDNDTLFHTDATQWVGKMPTDVHDAAIDLLTLSAHKLYGPKGIGALFTRRRSGRVRLQPIIEGGGQERGLRSGTIPVQQIVGLGKACELCDNEMHAERQRTADLRDRLESKLLENLEQITINGDTDNRLPNITNMSFGFVEGEGLMMALGGIAVSSGSACTSASLEPSYVLKALGVGDELAHSSLRFSLGRFTTEQEIDTTAQRVTDAVNRLRSLSPLWDMHLEGVDINAVEWSAG